MPPERRLAAILSTDMVGSTALMAESEEAGLRARGNSRDDDLYGGLGNDVLGGASGDNFCDGGAGHNTIEGDCIFP